MTVGSPISWWAIIIGAVAYALVRDVRAARKEQEQEHRLIRMLTTAEIPGPSLTPDAAGIELDDWELDEWEQEFVCEQTEDQPSVREIAWLRSAGVQW